MNDRPFFSIDTVKTFIGFFFISGWADGGVELWAHGRRLPSALVVTDRSDVASHCPGINTGFEIRCILGDVKPENVVLSIRKGLHVYFIENPGITSAALRAESFNEVHDEFFALTQSGGSVLELGSRARSATVRRSLFSHLSYTGMDILNGENVDVIADAHAMPLSFYNSFDYVYAVSVWEHLIWPWKVSLELNKVMKMGGVAFIQSHQTWPKHDVPWDFFRFSAEAWGSLFCEATGFCVLKARDGLASHIIPANYTGEPSQNIENEPASLLSMCIIEKIGMPKVEWNATPQHLGMYPA